MTITTNPCNIQCVQTLRSFQQKGAIAKFHICSVSKQCFAPTASSALLSIQLPEHALWLDSNFMNKYNGYHLQWVRSD